jgi:hypothetical protein
MNQKLFVSVLLPPMIAYQLASRAIRTYYATSYHESTLTTYAEQNKLISLREFEIKATSQTPQIYYQRRSHKTSNAAICSNGRRYFFVAPTICNHPNL